MTANTESLTRQMFAGKVVLIAGASRGIGAATAQAFARAGAKVVLAARDKQALESIANRIREVGEAVPVQCDVATPGPLNVS
jgi:NADP-dependent 3-hydroxy acid dehydrogenase YdfG